MYNKFIETNQRTYIMNISLLEKTEENLNLLKDVRDDLLASVKSGHTENYATYISVCVDCLKFEREVIASNKPTLH